MNDQRRVSSTTAPPTPGRGRYQGILRPGALGRSIYLLFRGLCSGLLCLALLLLALVAVCGAAWAATLARARPDSWAWLTILIMLAVLAAATGAILGTHMVDRCIRARRRGPMILGVRHRGPIAAGVSQPSRTPIEPLLRRIQYALRQAGARGTAAEIHPRPIPKSWNGPFAFDEFGQIQILLNKDVAAWYYNSYFDQVSDPGIYARYYQYDNATQKHEVPSGPSARTPGPDGAGTVLDPRRAGAETGGMPGDEGPQGILMTLKSVHYSSRYGGSVRLVFEMEEDYYYEFRFEPFVYDLSALELSVYVVPLAKFWNPLSSQIGGEGRKYPRPQAGGVFLEYRPEVKATYVLVYPDTELGRTPSPPAGASAGWSPPKPAGLVAAPDGLASAASDHLGASLARWKLAQQSARSFDPPISFVYGLLHDLHRISIPDETIRPERISIRDNDLDLHTRQGEFSFSVSCQIGDLSIDYPYPIDVTVQAHHDWPPTGLVNWPYDNYAVPEEIFRVDYPHSRHTGWYQVLRYSFSDPEDIQSQAAWFQLNVDIDLWVRDYGTIHTFRAERVFYAFARLMIPMVRFSDTGASELTVYELAKENRGGTIVDTTVSTQLFQGDKDKAYGGEWPEDFYWTANSAAIRLVAQLRIK